MAKSRFEYVKQFEMNTKLLPNTFLVVRIDGHKFTGFCQSQAIKKPNDTRLANPMNYSASVVMEKYNEIKLSYSQSDEFSFCIDFKSKLYSRRSEKITTNIVSLLLLKKTDI
jgi:tRNA(His) guanylyltransferase